VTVSVRAVFQVRTHLSGSFYKLFALTSLTTESRAGWHDLICAFVLFRM